MITFPMILLRLGVATALGAIVGFEREQKERGAGIRTLALVSLGSSLFTIVSAYGFLDLLGIPHVTLDPTRIASYIVAGIGFLGGGTIFLSRYQEKVKGLTTAASIWVMAAVGIACGAGMIFEAIAAIAMMLVVLILLRFVEQRIVPRGSSNLQQLQIEATHVTGQFIAELYEIAAHNNLSIEKLKLHTGPEVETIELLYRVSDATRLANAISELRDLPGVHTLDTDMGKTLVEKTSSKDAAPKSS